MAGCYTVCIRKCAGNISMIQSFKNIYKYLFEKIVRLAKQSSIHLMIIILQAGVKKRKKWRLSF
jgi:hypothetical protein